MLSVLVWKVKNHARRLCCPWITYDDLLLTLSYTRRVCTDLKTSRPLISNTDLKQKIAFFKQLILCYFFSCLYSIIYKILSLFVIKKLFFCEVSKIGTLWTLEYAAKITRFQQTLGWISGEFRGNWIFQPIRICADFRSNNIYEASPLGLRRPWR